MINLFLNYWIPESSARKSELQIALFNNLFNNNINTIYLMLGDAVEFKITHPKIKLLRGYERPTFKEMFEVINEVTYDTDLNIIANSDIIFDSSLILVKDISYDSVYCLSRWAEGVEITGPDNISYSQDVWVWRGHMKELGYADFTLGQIACDNRILYEFEQAGYEVFNPSLDIVCKHHHASNERTYAKESRVDEPHSFCYPHRLNE